MRNVVISLSIILVIIFIYVCQLPFIFGQTSTGFIFIKKAYAGMPITLSYRHSVMKTPVQENLYINDTVDGLSLKSTRYQSFGVGLPFLASEGHFHQEGTWFVLDNMHREYLTLSLRNGVSNNGVIQVDEESYDLPGLMPLGTELYIYICPLYQGIIKAKSFRRGNNG